MENQLEMGKTIRELRQRRGLTQEALAKELSVTPQAVSKWESAGGLPDIAQLPRLSAALGVTVDELFSLTDDEHLQRIDHMLLCSDFLNQRDFEDAERLLLNQCIDKPDDLKAHMTLADLYQHRAESYNRLSERAAKRVLELDPNWKPAHYTLTRVADFAPWDWNIQNHRDAVRFYRAFVREHPDNQLGHMCLLENLLADNRLSEAEEALSALKALGSERQTLLYRGYLAAAKGDVDAARSLWKTITDRDPEDWRGWSVRANAEARLGCYDEAKTLYRREHELTPKPRFVDGLENLAYIQEIQGLYADAAATYDELCALMREDWNDTESTLVQKYRANALRCRSEPQNAKEPV